MLALVYDGFLHCRAAAVISSGGKAQRLANVQSSEALRVTVITPTYNQAPFIAQCIRSVLNQTHRNIEYLIFDACSTDGTDKIIESYLGDPRIIYRREPDSGQANAINKGLDTASGHVVCWLNSDDFFFDHETLAKVCRIFTDQEKVDAVTGDGYFAAADGSLTAPILVLDASRISHRALSVADNFLQPATFWRRNELRLDEDLHFVLDWKLFLAMYKTGRSFFYLREFLAVYRLHGVAKTAQDNAARKREVCEILRFSGAGAIVRGWAWLIYRLYSASESLRFPLIKMLARSANIAMFHLSRGRIFSC